MSRTNNRDEQPPPTCASDPTEPEQGTAFPLSPVQYSMLLHTASAASTGVYILQMLVAVREALDVSVLERALREQVDRHPTLRTTFWLDNPEGPKQSVRTHVDVAIEIHDLRHLDDHGRRAGLRAFLDADKVRSFDLADGHPPMRYAVIRTGEDEYTFVWTLHHAVMDGRSCMTIMVELFVTYDRMRARLSIDLPARRPYADYITWLSTQDFREAEAFWRDRLEGFTEPTPLLVDEAVDLSTSEVVFGATEVELAEEATARLYALAEEHGVTPNNFVQAAWAILLHQLSGRPDVVFGATRACRSFADGADAMIGLFVNTLPFRVRVTPEMTVVELLGRLRQDQVRLRDVEHSSLAQIRRWTGFSSPGGLFESVVTFENYRYATAFRLMGSAADHRVAGFEGYTSFLLTLSAYRDVCLALNLGYDRRRFTDTTVLRLLTHLCALLTAMTVAPGAALSTLPAFAGVDRASDRSRRGARQAPRDDDAFWAARLADIEPLRLPLRHRPSGPPVRYDEILVELPQEWDTTRPDDHRALGRAEWLLTGILAFLARCAGEDGRDIDVSWQVEPDAGVATGAQSGHQARHLPLRVPPMTDGRDFAACVADVTRQLDLLADRGAYLHDIWMQHPRLRERAWLARDGLPVVVELVEDLTVPAVTRPGTALLVHIPRASNAFRVLVSADASYGGTAETLRARLITYLKAAAQSPHTDVTRLPLMPGDELRQVLVDWNDTATEYPRSNCAHHLFMLQVGRRPDSPAVIANRHTLTYRELDRRSSRLAAFIARRGAEPGSLVGIYLERSADLVVAVLAVMKAGAAFVPLDPIYPADHLARIATTSGVRLLLTQASLEEDVRHLPTHVVSLDRERDAIAHADEALQDRATPDGLAYLIFTSGSTGRPKGVRIGHRGLTNLLCSLARIPGFTAHDRLLAVTTVCFDMAYAELLLPLVTGGVVEVAAALVAADGRELRRHMEETRPTVMQATPATWRMLIAAGWTGDQRLTVLCGGEAMSRDLADALLDRAGQLWNLYGPTETTVFASIAAVTRDEPIAIGRPIDNTRLFVLDPRGEPVPPGMSGEAYIGGDGVAFGYHGEPDLTRESFVSSPLCPDGALLYRTGDRVRHLPDGRIEFLDRFDNQVKINGYRVELREVEATLREYPGVADAVVVARQGAAGSCRLVGYLTAVDPNQAILTAGLRRHLTATLPRYMLPAALLTLPRLPRTPNGKVDRRALSAAADADPLPPDMPYVAPRTRAEQVVAAIWRAVLGSDGVGIDENFFDAGGDSLLLMHVATRLRTEFDQSLTNVDLLAYPTIRALAERLSTRSPDDAGAAPADDGRRRVALEGLRQRRLAVHQRPDHDR